jgi:Low molecular weight phosphotyrosine protein phosphatase
MKKRVLILCTGNSARSQMAEGLLRHRSGNRFEVESAGTRPGERQGGSDCCDERTWYRASETRDRTLVHVRQHLWSTSLEKPDNQKTGQQQKNDVQHSRVVEGD